jgi:predicted enzyme related to lactoylglutathione lyase
MPKPVVVQFEITGSNGAALKRFYSGLFGWESDQRTRTTPNFSRTLSKETGLAGAIADSWDGGPGQVTVFVDVADLEATLVGAEELGGRVLPTAPRQGGPVEARGQYYDVPARGMRFAYVADPEGHVIGVAQGLQHALELF